MHPTALVDQLTAATRDARHHLSGLADHLGATVTQATAPGRIPRWLHSHLSALLDALQTGQARCCPHLVGGPGVAYAAVWAPALLACPACAATLLRAPGGEDDTCDCCRRIADQLHPGVIATGPILLTYGTCHDCTPTAPTPLFQPPAVTRPEPSPPARRRPCTRRKGHRR